MTLGGFNASFVWDSFAPKRVQFFTWLLIQGRTQSRSNLLRKNVVDTAVCEICQEEIAEHVIKGCPFAREFWAKIGFSLPFVSFGAVGDIHSVNCPASFPQKHLSTFVALCCWQLRKRRMGLSSGPKQQAFNRACISEAKLWKLRLPRKWVGLPRKHRDNTSL